MRASPLLESGLRAYPPGRLCHQSQPVRRLSASGAVIILCLLFLLAVDTTWGRSIPFRTYARVLVPLVLVLLGFPDWCRGRIAIPPAVRFALFGFVAVGLLSVAFSNAPVLAGAKLAAYLCVMSPLVASGIAGRLGPGSQAMWRLSQAAFCILVVNLCMLARSPFGMMGGTNAMGGLVVLLFPLMLFNASLARPGPRRMGQLGIVLCVITVLLSRGRGSVFAVYVMFVVHYVLGHVRSGGMRAILTAAVVCAVSLSVAFMAAESNDYVHSYVYKSPTRVIAVAGAEQGILADRTEVLQTYADAFRRRPLLGYGFGLSHRVRPDDIDMLLDTGRLHYAVGEIGSSTMGLLLGGGVLLLAAFLTLVASILSAAVGSYTSPQTPVVTKTLLRALVAAILGLLVAAQTENMLLAPLTLCNVTFWLYLGILLHSAVQR